MTDTPKSNTPKPEDPTEKPPERGYKVGVKPGEKRPPGRPKGKTGYPSAMKGKKRQRKSARQLAAKKRALEALEYKINGYTYKQIAEFLGYRFPQSAHEAVKSVLQTAITEKGAEALEIYTERLERLLQAAFNAAVTGDVMAVDVCARLMDRFDRLYGLSKPAKMSLTNPEGTAPAPTLDWGALIAQAMKAKANGHASNGAAVNGEDQPQSNGAGAE